VDGSGWLALKKFSQQFLMKFFAGWACAINFEVRHERLYKEQLTFIAERLKFICRKTEL
jgi:hypothetical protein